MKTRRNDYRTRLAFGRRAAGVASMLTALSVGIGHSGPEPENSPMEEVDKPRADKTGSGSHSDDAARQRDNQGKSEWLETWLRPDRLVQRIGGRGAGLGALSASWRTLRNIALGAFARNRDLVGSETLNRVRRGNFAGPGSRVASDSFGGALRLVTWNIERGLQYDSIVHALKHDLPAELYLLQEVDVDARRTDYRDVAADLARELGMHFVFGIEFQELIQGGSGRPALHGQAILSRYPIRRSRILRFAHQPKDWSDDWLQPRHGGRMALVALIDTPCGPLLVYNVHLESRGGDAGRARQMRETITDLRRQEYAGPVVIGGDLNTATGRTSPVIAVAERRRFHLLPFERELSQQTARRQKDWILARGIGFQSARIGHHVSASDHKPLSAELNFRPGEASCGESSEEPPSHTHGVEADSRRL